MNPEKNPGDKIRQAIIIIIQEILVYKQQDEPDKLEGKRHFVRQKCTSSDQRDLER